MKFMVMAACTVLGLFCDCAKCMAFGGPFEGPPELRDALKCEVRVVTNNVAMGSRVEVSMTVENTAAVDVQLPCPGTFDEKLRVRTFLLAGQATGAVQRLSIPDFVFPDVLTTEQKEVLERGTGWWGRIYVPSRWIAIPPGGKEQFRILVEISPKTKEGRAVTLAPGVYGLQSEIEYSMRASGSDAYLATNQWTSAERILKAKASGVFLVDMQKLWTGRMQSNVAQLTITNHTISSQ